MTKLKRGDEKQFTQAALDLFRWQSRHNPEYKRLLLQQSLDPKTILRWQEIPAVPQTLFKTLRLACHPKRSTRYTFLSSGTTGTERSHHHFTSLDLYQEVSTAQVPLFPSRAKTELHFLTHPPEQAPHSSLARMFSFWKERFGTRSSKFWVEGDQLRLTALRQKVEQIIQRQRPVGLLGPAFSFVHLLDAWSDSPLRLPAGSFVLETGGFKGKTREVRKPTFYRQLSRLLGITDQNIWNEYGMCELSSQAYARGAKGEHQTPPWARVLVIDPSTNREVNVGQRGLVRWIDLANVDSVLAIQTHDVATRTKEGFLLIGRLPQLPLRGCSLSVEDLKKGS